MSNQKIANRYAAALLSMSKDQAADQDDLVSGLEAIGEIFKVKELKKVLASPVVDPKLLTEVFTYATGQLKAGPLLGKFLRLLIESRRTALLPLIAQAFRLRLQQQRGEVDAVVTTAVALSDEDLQEIGLKLQTLLGKKVVLKAEIDTSILGGFVVRVENSLLDLSLKTKLENMTKMAVS